ncbi:neurotransmitter-gated ion-channel ligand binding domain-containing protein [Ditylenchus destructor]|uniref:Neurotransmitter-gated ion-channel ligand binding domain-containing protein n=1 Tax=Ditylenchus destructor TaxID=166010 RepID=A0AAD4R5G9_9BILA|nr:neurotransmitter-gated ion-channel ligand binding domain-containing protein [Ditylenchus destructor]
MSVVIFCWIYLFLHNCHASDDEYRLLQDLRENYDPVERPVQDHTKPLNVNLKIILQQILDVDEKNQVLTLVVWEQLTWFDYKMKWSPEEYGGIQDVRFPYDALWKPDIILFNSADEKFDARFPVNFVVQHTGHVLQAPPAIVKSSCEIDITWFPFDEQICHLQYGSWTYTREHLDLFIDDTDLEGDHKMDLQYYVENGEWELIATPAQRKTADFGNNSFVELYFRLQIQRKTIYYGMNWIIPSILFLLSNVLGFTMPSECGEKITLQTTNLLSVTVFLGMVADVTPPTSKSVPIIAAFFSVSMIILGSSIIFTLLIINVHFRSPRTHKMSPWVRTAFLEWLPWLLLMNRPGKQFKKPKKHSRTTRSGDSISQLQKMRQPTFMTRQSDSVASRMGQVDSVNSTIMGTNKIAPRQFGLDPLERQSLLMEQQPGGTVRYHRLDDKQEIMPLLSDSVTAELLRNTLRELSDYLRMSKLKMDEEEEEEEAKADWRFMAMALDRACLFFYAMLAALLPAWFWAAYRT